MKQSGVTNNDPRYASLLKILQPTPVDKAKPRNYATGQNLTISKVVEDRERILLENVRRRILDLEKLNSNNNTLDRQRLIELKQLTLINLQRNLRNVVSSEINNIAYTSSKGQHINFYRRNKILYTPAPCIISERFERQKREEEIASKRKRLKDFLTQVMNHAKSFSDYHIHRAQIQKKLNRQILKAYMNREKREQILKEKLERDRINALKRNDETEYRKLLEQTKNKRLKLLIEQTDAYLEQIGEKVEEQQANRSEPTPTDNSMSVLDISHDPTLDEKQTVSDYRKSYYTRIHKIQEEIKEQPSILVGGKLKEYQMDGLTWLVSLYNNKLNGILADEMGLGKTIQTIALLSYLIERKNNKGPYLIVVPLSTISNWSLEFSRWIPGLADFIVVYKGVPAARKKIYHKKIQHGAFNICLTTFDYVLKDKSSLSKIKWKYVIVDEGHRMKNHNSKISSTLSKYYHSEYRIILTGTPLQNSLPELWALLNFLLPSIFNSVDNFEQWFNKPFASTGEKVEMNEEETLLVINRLHKVLRPFLLRRMKSQVESQLPEKMEKVIKCEMSAWQRRMYDNMTNSGVMTLGSEDGQYTQKGLMNTLMQLRKICNHPFIFNQEGWRIDENLYRSSGKMEMLDRILPKLKQGGHRVLIFSQMTATLDIFEDYLTFRHYKYLRLDGSTKSEDREALLRLFNDPQSPYFIFILSTRAGGLGLNLQTADTVVLFDSDWNPQMDLQAQDRAHRIGQKNKVLVLRLITVNSIEEKILERANFKLDLDSKIIEAGMFNKNSNAADRKNFLMSLLKDDDDDDEEDNEVPSNKQINQMIARSDDEYAMFQKMDRDIQLKDQVEFESKGLKPPSRLMQLEELPDWLREDYNVNRADKEEHMLVEYGRGRRKRSEVTYLEEDEEDDDLDILSTDKRVRYDE